MGKSDDVVIMGCNNSKNRFGKIKKIVPTLMRLLFPARLSRWLVHKKRYNCSIVGATAYSLALKQIESELRLALLE